MEITNSIKYVGVNDHEVDLFEGQYIVPNGMAYNSYVILDEKIAVMDTVDINFKDEWLSNIAEVLGDKKPEYLIVQHMEPDHSANIKNFLDVYPDATVVGNAKTFTMMDQFFQLDPSVNRLVVKNNETLTLGEHVLTFVFAPMVHWPEVMVTYDSTDKVLFSADGFGKFGALDVEEDWDCEARRYYIGIVGKYGAQVQKLLKIAATLDIQIICPLHGPVLTENLGHYIEKYDIWSSYRPENEGVMIAYTSVYGNTKKAVELLAEKLKENGCPKVVVADLARDDMAECVEDAFRYDRLVLATTTYNGDIFPFMRTFIEHLTERSYQNRTVAFIENGTWAATAKRIMAGMLEKSNSTTDEDLLQALINEADRIYNAKVELAGPEAMNNFAKQVTLQVLDSIWRAHITALDALRQGIYLRGYAQKQPKQEYKREAFSMFETLLDRVRENVMRILMTVRIQTREEAMAEQQAQAEALERERARAQALAQAAEQAKNKVVHDDEGRELSFTGISPAGVDLDKIDWRAVSRNDLCPCGSGKKFKNCHGHID